MKDERKGLGGTSKKKWAIIIAVLVIGAVAALLGTLSGGGSDDTAAERERLAAIAEEQRIEAERLAAEQQRLERKRLEAAQTRGTINGHDYVDLGLSVKWATCNVGASNPGDYGNYYAWGETTTKSDYSPSTSTTDGKQMSSIAGNPTWDAARKNWGSPWRLPTGAEFQELRDNCIWKWTTRNGHNGYKVTSKKNGNSIFLPAAGRRDGTSFYDQGSYGAYWSASPLKEDNTDRACRLGFRESGSFMGWLYRYNGHSVRPVSE